MDTPFDALATSDAFEALIYDLLEAEGFSDLVWRGPGPDGGRDIEATWSATDPIGGVLRTKWYIECKWYTDSVPFSEIEPKLLAASVVRADYLLVATSARVRNTAMDSIATWLETRGQPFRIRYWTGTDILRLTVRHSALFRKHFPKVTPPSWGSLDSDRQLLRVLLGTSSERLTWRVLPAVQLLSNRLPEAVADVQLQKALESELDFIASMLRAHDAFSAAPVAPSVRTLPVFDCIDSAVKWLTERGKSISCGTVDPAYLIRTSPPFLKCAIFELIHNAATYQTDVDAIISFTSTDHHWMIEIANTSTEALIDPWPLLGFRSANAKAMSPSGQGLGCWIVNAMANHGGFTATWSIVGGKWIARLQGARS